MKLHIEYEKLKEDSLYRNMALDLIFEGKKPLKSEDGKFATVELDDINQSVLPKLYSDKIRMDDLNAWIEVDEDILDQQVPDNFPEIKIKNIDNEIVNKEILFKDYLFNFKIKDSKALILVAHKGNNGAREDLTKSEELYIFIDYFKKDESLSNVFSEKEYIDQKILEFNPDSIEI